MAKIRGVALAGFVCFVSVLASADSISNIPITGDATKGFVQTVGDFNIQGPSLGLFQGLPEGGNSIGLCSVGTVCDFSYSIGNATTFCQYCTGYSSGFLGNKVASFLDASLLFTGSDFYSGSAEDFQIMQVPMTLAGTIVGYKLVNCSDGVGCSLGPIQFALHIVGQGTGQFYLQPDGNIYGGITSFSGTATVVPEPMSLVLTATGLVGIWARRKIAQSKQG